MPAPPRQFNIVSARQWADRWRGWLRTASSSLAEKEAIRRFPGPGWGPVRRCALGLDSVLVRFTYSAGPVICRDLELSVLLAFGGAGGGGTDRPAPCRADYAPWPRSTDDGGGARGLLRTVEVSSRAGFCVPSTEADDHPPVTCTWRSRWIARQGPSRGVGDSRSDRRRRASSGGAALGFGPPLRYELHHRDRNIPVHEWPCLVGGEIAPKSAATTSSGRDGSGRDHRAARFRTLRTGWCLTSYSRALELRAVAEGRRSPRRITG